MGAIVEFCPFVVARRQVASPELCGVLDEAQDIVIQRVGRLSVAGFGPSYGGVVVMIRRRRSARSLSVPL